MKNYIDENKDDVPEASEELKLFMNDWILTLRKKTFIWMYFNMFDEEKVCDIDLW